MPGLRSCFQIQRTKLCNKSELFPILQVNICLLFVGGLNNIFGDDFFFLGRSPHNPSQVSLFTLRASPLHPTKGVQMALWQSQFLGFIKTYPRHHLFPLHHTTSILEKPIRPTLQWTMSGLAFSFQAGNCMCGKNHCPHISSLSFSLYFVSPWQCTM